MDWEVVLHWAPDPNHSLFLGSVQFCHSVVSNSLWTCGLQHTRPPCLSSTPRVYSTSCPLSWWCYPTISSSVIPFSFRLQSFPASGSFPVSQLFTSCGQSIGASASAVPTIIYFSSLISLSCKKPQSVNPYAYFHVRAKGKAKRFWLGK